MKAIDLSKTVTLPLSARKSKVDVAMFARPGSGGGAREMIARMPRILAAETLRALVAAWVRAVRAGRPPFVAFGAHVLKVGLAPLLVDLMRRGAIGMISMNGAGAVHDTEVGLQGRTSEDVAEGLIDGTFGMARETGEALNGAAHVAAERGLGLGETLGEMILEDPGRFPHRDASVLAAARFLGIPATVHVAIGTDIVHVHPTADGAAIGAATFRDFRIFCARIGTLERRSLYVNMGSAVLLPEVFLKALTVVRNQGRKASGFTTANLDMREHYRPCVNVLNRPTLGSGQALQILGHHEIVFPLVYEAVVEELSSAGLDAAPGASVRASRRRSR